MTVTPSTSLHVETPKLADIKTSSTYPPTPVTPYSHSSATSSRLDLPAPPLPEAGVPINSASVSAQPSPDTSAKIDSAVSTADTMPPADSSRSPADQALHDGQHPAQKDEGNEGLAGQIGMPGIVCAPPAILPPSPPLTVADARDEPEAGGSTFSGPAGSSTQLPLSSVPPPSMREEDISNWRASMHEGGGEEAAQEQFNGEAQGAGEEQEGGDMNGEYDEYDLGYSPESPVGPSHARTPTTPTGITSLQKQDALNHPLRMDIHPPSPPPWEVIHPPESIENVLAESRVYPSHGAANGRRPLTSRPLIPRSAYYFGPPPIDSAYGSDPVGHIGVHHPREIIRVERDYASGELAQFAATYPLELEGRITPTQFLETINTINEHLIEAHSLRHAFIDNALSFFTLQLSRLVLSSHYEKEMQRLQQTIAELNAKVYNPVGLNILWPRKAAFMFLEIEYY
ncbi:Erf4 domain-containing protein [Phanerochaete sordida]|uniref:Ras modification protein ERF4 n=1 Tax=Phanerochaete sordida TaxID=48140 RepID=A0A9P3GFW7_9APHY|nr:Erf4 domain-containing protein [Phanerochaete sordida]